ncbi:MAG: uroporphyrinogen-III synthase [Roseovarius sp.]
MANTILITRPEPSASGFAQKLRDRLGARAEILVSPILRIDHLPPTPGQIGTSDVLVLTSAHALPALAHSTGGQTCYCVGPGTAAAARRAGLSAIDGGGTAEHLLKRLIADHPGGKLLYLRGEHVAADLAQSLNQAGIETHELIVYRQLATPLSDTAQTLLSGDTPVIAPLFSARSARLFLDAAPPAAPLKIAAISPAVANTVSPGRAQEIAIAASPTADAMLDTIEALA